MKAVTHKESIAAKIHSSVGEQKEDVQVRFHFKTKSKNPHHIVQEEKEAFLVENYVGMWKQIQMAPL